MEIIQNFGLKIPSKNFAEPRNDQGNRHNQKPATGTDTRLSLDKNESPCNTSDPKFFEPEIGGKKWRRTGSQAKPV